VVRHRNRDGGGRGGFLHDDVTAAPANLAEAVRGEDRADLPAGENAESTQSRPRPASRRARFSVGT